METREKEPVVDTSQPLPDLEQLEREIVHLRLMAGQVGAQAAQNLSYVADFRTREYQAVERLRVPVERNGKR